MHFLYRMEKDQALAAMQTIEIEHSREMLALKVEDQTARQRALDLAHKVPLNALYLHLQPWAGRNLLKIDKRKYIIVKAIIFSTFNMSFRNIW